MAIIFINNVRLSNILVNKLLLFPLCSDKFYTSFFHLIVITSLTQLIDYYSNLTSEILKLTTCNLYDIRFLTKIKNGLELYME